jgi:tripartite-type tricarboxylate transporter receptor subunit TctC
LLARILAQQMSQQTGTQIVVSNQPGAGGLVAAQSVKKETPGSKLVLLGTNTLAYQPLLFRDAAFDIEKDTTPAALIATQPLVLVANAALPVKTVAELADYLRRNPGKVAIATNGNGTLAHLAAAQLDQSISGGKLAMVPYKGAGPALADLIGGQVQLAFVTPATALEQSKSGRVRAIAVAAPKRSALLPDVPTFSDARLPEIDAQTTFGFFLPPKTSAAHAANLFKHVKEALQAPQVRDKLRSEGFELEPKEGPVLAQRLHAESERWAKLIRASGMKAAQ